MQPVSGNTYMTLHKCDTAIILAGCTTLRIAKSVKKLIEFLKSHYKPFAFLGISESFCGYKDTKLN